MLDIHDTTHTTPV